MSEDSIEIHEIASLIQTDRPSVKKQANGHFRTPRIKDSHQMEEAENLITMQAIIETENTLQEAETSFCSTANLLDTEDHKVVQQNGNPVLVNGRFTAKQHVDNGDSGIESVAGLNGDFETPVNLLRS